MGDGSSFSKYTTDTKTTLDPADDAASVNWGGSWRMPTHAEQQELVDNCTWEWVTSYNNVSVMGYVVTGSNGNSIFLPVAGYYIDGVLLSAGSYGNYWSSSLREGDNNKAWRMNFYSSSHGSNYTDDRLFGYSVRAVRE